MADNSMMRVLVIDDEAPIRLLCRVNLEAEGMTVIEAADGPTGLDQAREHTPDVVLLDVMMPGLDIGGVDYVTKPFDPLELAPLVRELLARIESGERDELRGEKLAALRLLMDLE